MSSAEGYLSISDPAPDAEWQVWYQDTFDRECPRQVEVEGQGLVSGLAELWARHLLESVRADGGQGFSRFNLWWKQAGRSIMVIGPWDGMVQLRHWIFGDKREATKGYVGDGERSLLVRVARVHACLVLAEQSSEKILETAESCGNRDDFERLLLSLE